MKRHHIGNFIVEFSTSQSTYDIGFSDTFNINNIITSYRNNTYLDFTITETPDWVTVSKGTVTGVNCNLIIKPSTNVEETPRSGVIKLNQSVTNNELTIIINQGSISLSEYEKYPLEQRFIEVYPDTDSVARDQTFGALGYVPLLGKDWDTGLPSEGTGNDSETNSDYLHGGWNRGTYYTRRVGEQEWTLENFRANYQDGGSLAGYKINQSRLDTAGIPMTLEESYMKNGLFAFVATPSNRYFNNVKVYTERTFPAGGSENLFGEMAIVHWNTTVTGDGPFDFTLYEDPNATAILVPQKMLLASETGRAMLKSMTISRTTNNGPLILVRAYDRITGLGTYHGSAPVVNDKDITVSTGNYTPTYWMVIVDTTGKPLSELLPNIKIEFGNSATPWYPHKGVNYVEGWSLPNQTDYLQLYGMMGRNLDKDNFRKHMLVKPVDTDIPWVNNYINSSGCEDALGVRFLPVGHKNNSTNPSGGDGNDGAIYYPWENFAHLTLFDSDSQSGASPSMWYSESQATSLIGHINWDVANNTIPIPGSTQYWQRNIRFVRNLTDDELGYRMWRRDTTDEILITSLSATQPTNTTEVPRGLLRGLAVRWFDNKSNPTRVLVPLSYLLAEVEKCKDNGGYRWIGWESGL